MMSEDTVLVEVTDGVATITINRPEARNALNRAVRRALPAAVDACEADDTVDVMILTGADPAFSAGVDLKEIGSGATGGDDLRSGPAQPALADMDMSGRDADGRVPWRGALPPRTKLLIGAVNGVAVTGGFELALGCDFLIASERARFADTHARVGVMPGWGLTVLLAQRIGVARAREMSVTGNFIDAQQAYEWGLVNHVVAHDELLPYCRKLAADSITIDQRAVRQMLATYQEVTDTTVAEGWVVEDRVSRAWEGAGFDPEAIEAKRRAIVDRGRSQIAD
jgi:enoyl-CoA hydratase/carnithine racemase